MTPRSILSTIIAATAFAVSIIPASAQMRQMPDRYKGAFNYAAPVVSEGYSYTEYMIPSGCDTIRLMTRVYLPEGDGPFPVVVTRTPYVYMTGDYIAIGREYARHGIGYIQQDCRGKGGSEGFFSPNVNERADGIALYKWLDEQPWCGDIGVFGSSYTALTGWIVGDSIPAKVKGMYLSHYGVDRHISCFRAGLFREDIMSGWVIDNAEEAIIKPERKQGQPIGENYYDFYLYRPQVEADEAVLGQKLQYYRDWITHTDYTDPYWNSGVWADLKNVPAQIQVPMTIVAGQFDHHEEGTILGYERLNPEVKAKSRLILGSWNHSFQTTPSHTPTKHAKDYDSNKDQFEWFYGLLVKKEEPKGEIRVYNIEADEWENFDSWPIVPSETKTLYLSPDKDAQQWNVLPVQWDKAAKKGKVGYIYDPEDPVYAEGGETLFTSQMKRGCHPMSEPGYRDDIISFVSEPLEEDLTIAGDVKVILSVRSDAGDTAFAFTMAEVGPDGTAYNMRTSITTLGYRNGLLEPRVSYKKNKKVSIEIVALPMMWTVKAGNRLRIDIKSSQFPEYAVHSNTAGVWAEQGETRIARQTVFLGGKKGSRVILPIIRKTEDMVEYGEIGFADLVSFLVQGFQCKWDGMSPEDQGLSSVYSYNSKYAGFTIKDINGDGIKELLIGDQFEDGETTLYDIYTIYPEDGSLIHLAKGGERDSFVITGNGTIVEHGSNSAFDSFEKGFVIKEGNLVVTDSLEDDLMTLDLQKFSDLAQ